MEGKGDTAHTQDELNLYILHMYEGRFLLFTTQIMEAVADLGC